MRRKATQEKEKRLRINQQIHAPHVRLIDSDGSQVGIVPIREARERAMQQGLDLIEVAPNAIPPVCKIMNYGKYRYEQGKRKREAVRHQRSDELKMIRVGPDTAEHDLETMRRKAERFLIEGHKVQFIVRFRGRQETHPELAEERLEWFIEHLKDVSEVERRPQKQGRQMIMQLAPNGQPHRPATQPSAITDES